MHKSIQIKNLGLSFDNKICFEDFSFDIICGSKIAITGANGSGKSSLLRILKGEIECTSGVLGVPNEVVFGYVPQIIQNLDDISGGQRFNRILAREIDLLPNVLLLDEPTNHLDSQNRRNLMRILRNYSETLIIVSHDTEILRNCVDILWHIDQRKVNVFYGKYDDYMRTLIDKKNFIEKELSVLERSKKDSHEKLIREQKRVSKKREQGIKKVENKRWLKSTADLKIMRAEKSQGSKLNDIFEKKRELIEKLHEIRLPEIIVPKFSILPAKVHNKMLISITNGSIGYAENEFFLNNINLTVFSRDRIAIKGENGSGKSTILKAILNNKSVFKRGDWDIPKSLDVGYLDQDYKNLELEKSVLENVSNLLSKESHREIRKRLNDFLFRTNEEVNILACKLSGGEKARLSLAKIAFKTPSLLILDEITNNIDLETRNHAIQVLKAFPGAIIIVSHDENFLQEINITKNLSIENAKLS